MCQNCDAGYFCLEGSVRADEWDCANATDPTPENKYCPRGTGPHALPVPRGYYSVPRDRELRRNREGALKCPGISNCLKGIQYPGLLWIRGDCAEGAKEQGDNAHTPVYVNEAAEGIQLGVDQVILSPYVRDTHVTHSRSCVQTHVTHFYSCRNPGT